MTLYVLTKALARYLELLLTLNPIMAPLLLLRTNSDPQMLKGDNVPPEVAIIAASIVALKLVYGLSGRKV